MINKLRKKFILYSMLSVFALLAVILGTINIVNFAVVSQDADNVTQMIAEHNGTFEGEQADPNAQQNTDTTQQKTGGPGQMAGPGSPETKDSTRYFTVAFNTSTQEFEKIVTYKINTYTEEEVQEWAASLLNSTTGWTKTYYRYRVYENGSSTYVTVIDQGRELSPSYRVLWASLIGSVVGLGISFVILLFVSKLFVKPIEDNDRKQKRFIMDAATTLKKPVAVIALSNETEVENKGDSDETKAISKQVGKLSKTVLDLSSLTTFEEEEKNDFQTFNFINTLKEVLVNTREETKHLNLMKDFPEEVELNGDEEQIHNLLYAVVNNIGKYAKKNVKLKVEKKEDRVVMFFENDSVYSIKDGPHEQCFERFYRDEEVVNKEIEGSGLGLARAKQIVDYHKGRIYARGENGNFILKIEL